MAKLENIIVESIENAFRLNRAQSLMLGGMTGSGGGTGGPPGGFIGKLPQSKVTYDLSELASSGVPASGSLVDNLNHIRYRIEVLENASGVSTSGGGHIIKDSDEAFAQRTYLQFVGSGVIVTDDLANDTTVVTISGGGISYPYTPEDVANKSDNITLSEDSSTLYPTQHAVKSYVDATTISGIELSGYMEKSVYDSDLDGVVDNSEALNGHPDTYFQTTLGFTPENVTNKTDDITLAGDSSTLYPTEHAVKSYVDSAALSGIVASGRYRQFVYATSGGDFFFIKTPDGNPVMALLNLE